MNAFVEKNRELLYSYYVSARIIGWLLIIIALIVAVVKSLAGFSDVNDQLRFSMIFIFCEQLALGFVLLGLILLGLDQFVRYLYEAEYQPGLILRHGDKVLYLYALGLTVSPISHYFFEMKVIGYVGTVHLFTVLSTAIVPAIAKALIFVGMAQILKRIAPMVEESKTLV